MVGKLALRNVLAYKRRTLLIGLILAFGAFLLTLSSASIETITANLRARYIDSFTADVIISADAYPAPSLAPQMNAQAGSSQVPEIPDFEGLVSFVSAHSAVKSYSPQLQAYVTATIPAKDGEAPSDAQSGNGGSGVLMGIDPVQYTATFPGQWEMISGEAPAPGIDGLWVTESGLQMLSSEAGGDALRAGDKVLVSCLTPTAGMKIREVEIRGVFRYLHPDPQLSKVSYIDALSLQLLLGLNLGASSEDAAAAPAISATDDPESLFNEGLFSGSSPSGAVEPGLALDPESLVSFVNSSPSIAESARTVPRYHFLLVRLKDGASYGAFARDVNAFASENHLALRVTDWSAGAGSLGRMVQELQSVFFFLILAVILVSLFVITNSLVLSVTERIPEIGTLRALGGQKGFIRGIVVMETLITGTVFGLAGTILASLLTVLLNATNISVPGLFFQVLFGGGTLRLALSLRSVLLSVGIVAGTGLAASLYPLTVALKIRPVQAMSQR
jgi:putative ABC transport system permease protein